MGDDATQGDDEQAEFTLLAQVLVDVAREIQLRAAHSTPVVPLTPTQGQIMRFVHAHPECTASDIADGAGLQRTNVSTALRELRGRGYLTSRRDESDGRAIRIRATERADATIGALRRTWADLLAGAWPDDAGRDVAEVTELLATVRARLGADRAKKAFPLEAPGPAVPDADSIMTR